MPQRHRSVRTLSVLLLSGAMLHGVNAWAKPAKPEAPVAEASAVGPVDDHPVLRDIAAQVDPAQLHATIEKLVSFGTRHTLSDTTSPDRGIGAARAWVKSRFEAISKDCGGCLTVVTPAQTVSGKRVPTPTEVMDVVAVLKGTEEPQRVIVIAGHLDSRVTDVMNATADAPGANDDASGVAAAIEAARVLSHHKFRATLVFAALSGEEQGLLGGKVLADYAKEQGWQVEADLNNDIVGNTQGEDGVVDNTHIRVFSEGTKAVETVKQANQRRYSGGEVDSPSRNLARYMDGIATRYLDNFSVRMVYRTDRFGRGGDQVPFLEAGFPAVRVTEAHENYTRQHQDLRTEGGVRYGDTIDGVDFPYLAQVTRLNALTMASLAWAPAPPADVKVEGALKHDTTLSWAKVPGAVGYRAWWRDTLAPTWQHDRWAGDATTVTLPNVVIDDWFFGVAAVSKDGYASPVVYPGPAGSFVAVPDPAGP
ncbi:MULTISPECIES: M20/M25/M40 family metallo-hydrolase [Nitrospirillum]|uniref:Peptidase M28-like protein n=1 Tax=Nitrospirillum amazonense TaxID=28077 RepID=A0A560G3K8_9PROT|nr:M20/M25/M40 family metallo-hydrolase [Nitrospirillum amazonense]MEC4593281.1 M20/M25/M40 family metallo-hydrolase [Nitrospirillum amazonense]TWB28487.1 peptidase M28-like protein [Nitrospirillum amazonense]